MRAWISGAGRAAALILSLIALAPAATAARSTAPGNQAFDDVDSVPERRTGKVVEPGWIGAPGRVATLGECLSYAVSKNPALKSAFFRWEAALARAEGASALPDPVFTWGFFVENIETRVGPQEQRFSLSQTIPWFGTLGAKGDAARETASAEREGFLDAKLRILYSVKSAYYDLYLLEREIEIVRSTVDLLGNWETVLRTEYETAIRGYGDLIKAQVELAEMEDRLAALEERRGPVEAKLRTALNLPDSIPVPSPSDSIDVPELAMDEEEVKRELLERNPDLRALGHLVRREESAVRLAGKESYPGITLGVEYIVTGEAMNPSLEESGKDAWMLRAGLNLPIWFSKYGAKRDEARARLEMSRYMLAGRKNELLEIAEGLCSAYRDAARRIDLYTTGLIPKAEQALGAVYASYRAGEADFLAVIDTQRRLLEFQLQLERSRVQKSKKVGEIEMIIGKDGEP